MLIADCHKTYNFWQDTECFVDQSLGGKKCYTIKKHKKFMLNKKLKQEIKIMA